MLANCIWHTIVLDGTMIFLAEIFLRPNQVPGYNRLGYIVCWMVAGCF